MTDRARSHPTSDLRGTHVLVPRALPDDPLAAAVRAAGGVAVPTELVRFAVAQPPDLLDQALRALGEGAHAWLAVTSATTVEVLAGRAADLGTTLAALTERVQVAAVGPATAAALHTAGVHVDLVPPGESSAATLLDVWPAAEERALVLLPHSEIAAPTLASGLRERGWLVDEVVAYRTVPVREPDPAVSAALAAGRIKVILLTSGSTARALVALYGVPPARVCAIGASTAQAAAEAGLTVHAVAEAQTPAGLVAAATHLIAEKSSSR
ncbi:uroporphyrinogen-III synthase [Georgenia yuyongxinii]|uniref:Uroporphyrinogen-III synthase n=1 Tax=Georgenia yuyongxinii TaxID=2589797 RepID=A0A552WTH8_9MICO|nr:uroporphyrinogen-III synthase [Georgenia yuyongxinii]TRW45996.1 uroporphyrinogen-III synthase [Georgenia yuyongxinii]